MLERIPLRRRVALVCATLGLLLSVAFAAAAVRLAEDYEEILVIEFLRGQAHDYAERLRTDPDVPLPRTQQLSGYLRRGDGSAELPPELVALAPGIHEIDEQGRHAGVFDTAAGRLVFVIDISAIEALEHYLNLFAAAVVVLGTLLGGWSGWLLAARAVAPVRRLADAVDALPVRAEPTALSRLVGADELGRLADAIDAYQSRLVEAAAVEQAFFADASHELRTPIAVVKGAVDVLADDPVTDAAQRRRLARLERGVDELADLMEAMLGLARRRDYPASAFDAATFLDEALAPTRAASTDALRVETDAAGVLLQPRAPALVVVRGLLRRLVPPLAAGLLQVSADPERIMLTFTPVSAGDARPASLRVETGDSALTPTLIGRFATYLDWHIEEAGSGGGSGCVILYFCRNGSDKARLDKSV